MVRWLVIAALSVLVVLGGSQLLIPPLAEHRIESRLTDGGGTAHVSVSGFPAVLLPFGDGGRISVSGSGLNLPAPEPGGGVFDKLDKFDRVDVSLTDFRAGPFAVSSFDLTRTDSSAPYHVIARGRAKPGDLASYGASRLGLPGGALLGFLGNQALGGAPVPIAVNMDLTSEGGRVVAVSGGGTVAGFPTGPLAELITSAIVLRL
jgi:hypothetical protein